MFRSGVIAGDCRALGTGPVPHLHVVHIIVGLSVGGAELMLSRLVLSQRVSNPGRRCTVVSLTSLGPVGEQMRKAGVDVVALGMRTPWSALRAMWKLHALLRRLQPDLVQTWMVHADLLGGLAARAAGIRAVVWGVRTTDFSTAPINTRVVRWLCARLSRVVPHTIVCAAEASRQSHEQAGYDAHRMVVIPNGFDTEHWQPDAERGLRMRLKLGLLPMHTLIGCVGRYNPAKDQLNFVQAMLRLAPSRPDCRFLLVGRGLDVSNGQLMRLIGSAGCADRFILVGEQADVRAHLDAMDVFVLPSRSEGFPNVLGEAMAMARPCVTTDAGDASSLLGDAGLVVPAQDPVALAAAVQAMLGLCMTDRQTLAQQARARLVSHFSLHRACQSFTQLQDGVVHSLAAQDVIG